jgi:serine phosphatase RsbU (regulator of sigma subunit)
MTFEIEEDSSISQGPMTAMRTLRILNIFFRVATFVFLASTMSFSVDSTGMLWVMWKDEVLLALTLLFLALLMAAGWWYTARKLRAAMSPEIQGEFVQRKVRVSDSRQAYNIWKEMKPSTRWLLAVAVFLMFGTIGPLSILMGSALHLITWQRVLIVTIASGSISASIILLGRKPVWMVIALLFFTSGNIFADRIEMVLTGRPPAIDATPASQHIDLSPTLRAQLATQRAVVGTIAIGLLAFGYVMFIVLLSSEGSQRLRLETEVAIAQGIQKSLVPSGVCKTAWCEVTGRTLPATEVGGDYFDIFQISEHQIAIVVADVAGHGVGAGILSAMTKSALRIQLQHDAAPARVLDNLNRALFGITGRTIFVTAGYLLLDAEKLTACIATAGHPPLLHREGSTGILRELRTASLGLGMHRNATFSTLCIPLSRGDSFLLYTDGITEATDPQGEQFGLERLQALFHTAGSETSEVFCTNIVKSVQTFTQGKELKDDITVVIVRT